MFNMFFYEIPQFMEISKHLTQSAILTPQEGALAGRCGRDLLNMMGWKRGLPTSKSPITQWENEGFSVARICQSCQSCREPAGRVFQARAV